MLKTFEAIKELLSIANEMSHEKVDLINSKGRVLSHNLKSKSTNPPHNLSAMDGYAIRKEDKIEFNRLKIIGESSAGKKFTGKLKKGEAVQIFTGAVIPENSECIIIQEDINKEKNFISIKKNFDKSDYIRFKGTDFDKNFRIDSPIVINPFTQSLLASMNYRSIPVIKKPKIALISTGNELVMPGEKKRDDQIYSSVSFGLSGLLEEFGANVRALPILIDDKKEIKKLFSNLENFNLIITIGGASEGKYDLIKETLNELNFKLNFFKVSMRPGKPVFAGKLNSIPLVGLPGNPVSALICSQILLKPMIEKMLKLPFKRQQAYDAILTENLSQNGNRTHYMRANKKVISNQVFVTPRKKQDSYLINELNNSDCLIINKRNNQKKLKGEKIKIIELLKKYWLLKRTMIERCL